MLMRDDSRAEIRRVVASLINFGFPSIILNRDVLFAVERVLQVLLPREVDDEVG
jgi:hypothetical protein